MPVPLDFDLIKAIMEHGCLGDQDKTVDPSTNAALRAAGNGKVITYIEALCQIDLLRDPDPLLGKGGEMWIGYKLSKHGREVVTSEDVLRQAVGPLIGGPQSEVSEAVNLLFDECKSADIDLNFKEAFLKTLDEIRICFDHGCFIAAIGLCGRILEFCLKDILMKNQIDFDPNAMVGHLIKIITARLPNEYLDVALKSIINIVNDSRIIAVHAKEQIPIPSRDQAIMVIYATRDFVRRKIVK